LLSVISYWLVVTRLLFKFKVEDENTIIVKSMKSVLLLAIVSLTMMSFLVSPAHAAIRAVVLQHGYNFIGMGISISQAQFITSSDCQLDYWINDGTKVWQHYDQSEKFFTVVQGQKNLVRMTTNVISPWTGYLIYVNTPSGCTLYVQDEQALTSLTLVPGYNLVAVPFSLTQQQVEATGCQLDYWSNSDTTKVWQHYDQSEKFFTVVQGATSLSRLTTGTIEPYKAYLIYNKGASNCVIGMPSASTTTSSTTSTSTTTTTTIPTLYYQDCPVCGSFIGICKCGTLTCSPVGDVNSYCCPRSEDPQCYTSQSNCQSGCEVTTTTTTTTTTTSTSTTTTIAPTTTTTTCQWRDDGCGAYGCGSNMGQGYYCGGTLSNTRCVENPSCTTSTTSTTSTTTTSTTTTTTTIPPVCDYTSCGAPVPDVCKCGIRTCGSGQYCCASYNFDIGICADYSSCFIACGM
jgi:hypothetical protein